MRLWKSLFWCGSHLLPLKRNSLVPARPLLGAPSLLLEFIPWYLVTEAGLRIFLAKSEHFWNVRASIYYGSFLCSVTSPPLQVTQAPFATVWEQLLLSHFPLQKSPSSNLNPSTPIGDGNTRSWLHRRRVLDWNNRRVFCYWLIHLLLNLFYGVRNSLTSLHFCWQIRMPVAGLICWFVS